jgi:hypothetical protein
MPNPLAVVIGLFILVALISIGLLKRGLWKRRPPPGPGNLSNRNRD